MFTRDETNATNGSPVDDGEQSGCCWRECCDSEIIFLIQLTSWELFLEMLQHPSPHKHICNHFTRLKHVYFEFPQVRKITWECARTNYKCRNKSTFFIPNITCGGRVQLYVPNIRHSTNRGVHRKLQARMNISIDMDPVRHIKET